MSSSQITSSPMSDAKPQDDSFEEEIEVDVVDDTPEEDRGRSAPDLRSSDEHDEELGNFSQNVQKRIKKLKYDFHEERRAKEASTRMRDEAVAYAQKIQSENQRLRDLVDRGEKVLVDEVKTRTERDLESARMQLKRAHEDGDPDSIVSAQELLSKAAYEAQKIQEYTPKPQQPQQPQQRSFTQPDQKAADWAKKNPWFRTDKEMTAVALAVHEDLVTNGVDTKSDEYYQAIDNRIRERFPEKFGDEDYEEDSPVLRSDENRRKPSTVVAPAKRTTGARPRKVHLTKTQVALAKRLGITPEDYAKQLLKLENQNG